MDGWGDCISPSCPPNKVHTLKHGTEDPLVTLGTDCILCFVSYRLPSTFPASSARPPGDSSFPPLCPLIGRQTPIPQHSELLASSGSHIKLHFFPKACPEPRTEPESLILGTVNVQGWIALCCGPSWALHDVVQHPWPLPARRQELPPPTAAARKTRPETTRYSLGDKTVPPPSLRTIELD